jgi:hypothetical protein
MQSEIKDLFCPVCKQSLDKSSDTLLALEETLYLLTLGRMLPAILHDMRHSIDTIRLDAAFLERRQKLLADARTGEAMRGINIVVEVLAKLNSSLSRICRHHERVIFLKDLAEALQAILQLYRIQNIPKLETLKKSNKKVHGTYLTVFSFLLQSVLIGLSRSMHPKVEIYFNISGEKLHTSVLLGHETSFKFAGNGLEYLNALVHLKGGEMIFSQDGSKTLIKWAAPLLNEQLA